VDGGAGDDTFNVTNIAAFDDDSLMITITGGTGTDAITFANGLSGTVNLADTTDVSISGVETFNAGTVGVNTAAITSTATAVTLPAGTTFRTVTGTTAAIVDGNANGTFDAGDSGASTLTVTMTAAQIDALTTVTAGASGGTFTIASSDTTGPITVDLSDTTYTTLANVDSVTFNSVTTGVVTATIDENLAVVGGQGGSDVLNVTADLGNVTLAASNFETVNFNAVQATIVTIANSATTVNATAGGVFILGTGGDTFNNSGAVAATVTGGSGIDTINHSGSTTLRVTQSDAGADIINQTGTGAITVVQIGASGITTVNLNATNTVVDRIGFNDETTTVGVTDSANRVIVNGFNTSGDLIALDTVQTTVATAAGAAPVVSVIAAAGNVTWASATADVIIFNYDQAGTTEVLAGDLTGAALIFNVGVITAANNSDETYVVAYDNNNAYIYQFTAATDTTVTAAKMALIGIINGAVVGSLGSADFVLAA
jgi:hypothetical protein